MRKFILIAPRCTPDQENAINEFVKTRAGWWHYSSDTWLLKFKNEVNTVSLRDEIRDAFPGLNFMVLGFPDAPHEWYGFGPPNWADWFKNVWD
jgi:hypothetical protein